MTPLPSQQPKPWKLPSSQVLAASHPPTRGIYHPKLATSRGTPRIEAKEKYPTTGGNKMWSGKQGGSRTLIP